jgi:hypothetical protein
MKAFFQAIVGIQQLITWLSEKHSQWVAKRLKDEIGQAIDSAERRKDTSQLEALLREK